LGYKIYLFTGDQRGNASVQAGKLGIEVKLAKTTEEKAKLTNELPVNTSVAIGNARIDIGTFLPSRLKIGVLQAEGIHTGILPHIDILIPSINDALDLLIDPDIFNATMRK
jgi:soluble P-type ATPase